MKILLIEDDEILVDVLVNMLTTERYAVDVAADGQKGWELASALVYDLIMLDVMLPKLDGISLCRRLRSHNNQTPILLLTAQDTSTSKVLGLDAGADDYMTKPFDQPELLARIRALQRRESVTLRPVLSWEALALNPNTREIHYNTDPIHLRPREYDLLELFLRNPQRVFSRGAILDHLWSFEGSPGEETVTSHIKGLRQHLKRAGVSHDPIETVYGIGYRLRSALPSATRTKASVQQASSQASQDSAAAGRSASSARANAATAEIWERSKQRLSDRIAVIERATTAGIRDTLADELRHQAEREAHKLAGSLGMFNFDQGSQLAHKAELTFQNWSQLPSQQRTQLATVVSELRQSVQQAMQSQTPTLFYPNAPSSLHSAASSMSRSHPTAATVLVVDDDPTILDAMYPLLEPWGITVVTLDDPRQFLEVFERTQPDLLVLDITMPHMDGLTLCQAIRHDLEGRYVPILVLTACLDAPTQRRVFEVGADDYVAKPIVGPELVTRILNRLERSRLMQSRIENDSLTGVANRRCATEAIAQLLRLMHHHPPSLCLAILQIDRLSHINQDHGYAVGDRVLSQFGQHLKRRFGGDDVVGRWGGRVFVVAMAGLTLPEGMRRLQTLQDDIRQMRVLPQHQGRKALLSFSAGLVAYPQATGAQSASWPREDWPACVSALVHEAIVILAQTRPGQFLSA